MISREACMDAILPCMSIRMTVTVRSGGLIEVRSPELHEGDQAEVTVIVKQQNRENATPPANDGWRRFAGAINTNDVRAGDNDRIDADLAGEHANPSKADP